MRAMKFGTKLVLDDKRAVIVFDGGTLILDPPYDQELVRRLPDPEDADDDGFDDAADGIIHAMLGALQELPTTWTPSPPSTE